MLPVSEGLSALRQERAFVDLGPWRKVDVQGDEAVGWLHDLLTTDIASLAPGRATRALLLSATGRIRADVHVIRREHDLLLLQDPLQPDHIGLLLHPYVLSSDVSLHDASPDLAVFAVPGRASRRVGLPGSEPSALGPGVDLVAGQGKAAWRVEDALVKAGLVEAALEDVDAWRILAGTPRVGPDLGPDSTPSEGSLEDAVDTTKGCFVGQESVARVRNLGHPARTLLHVGVAGLARRGDAVYDHGDHVGSLTSVTDGDGGTIALVLVGWAAREADLTLGDGRPLYRLPQGG